MIPTPSTKSAEALPELPESKFNDWPFSDTKLYTAEQVQACILADRATRAATVQSVGDDAKLCSLLTSLQHLARNADVPRLYEELDAKEAEVITHIDSLLAARPSAAADAGGLSTLKPDCYYVRDADGSREYNTIDEFSGGRSNGVELYTAAQVQAILNERREALRLDHDKRAVTIGQLSRAMDQMRAAFHVNMYRLIPGKSHAEISAEIDKACALAATMPSTAPSGWISVDDRLPEDETPVIILLDGVPHIGELRWETPSHEETFKAFRYWDCPHDDGQGWEWHQVTRWMPLPDAPSGDDV